MISVIIPLYNKEAIIERTLQSVLSQDYDDYEVIIVDDGSTDNSATVAKRFIDNIPHSKCGARWTYILQENGGPSKARNTGVKHAKGEWLYLIDADDEMESGVLKHFSQLVQQQPQADLFLGEVYYNNGQSKTLSNQYTDGFIDDIFKALFYRKINPCSGTLLYRKSLCVQHPYKEKLRRFEDLECLLNKFRDARLYATHYPTSIVNVEFAEASRGRKNIEEDFVGHISFKGKSFWEKMCLYQFYLGERTLYSGQIEKLYPMLKYRYDLLLIYKILKRFHVGS